MTEEDEALIQRFIGLQTNEVRRPRVIIPTSASSNITWDLCIMAKVISDRSVLDAPFSAAMLLAWGADPATHFQSIAKNCFLVEFKNEEDLTRAQAGGPWSFRGDLVATKKVASHLDLNPDLITHASLWVQFHHVPLNSLTEEGLAILGGTVGVPISAPIQGYIGGKRFVKIKVVVPLSEPLKDSVSMGHLMLGDLEILCTYEKITRACRYYGKLGHEMHTCPDHQKMSLLMQNPPPNIIISPEELLAPKFGVWLVDPLRVPRPNGLRKESTFGPRRNSAATGLGPPGGLGDFNERGLLSFSEMDHAEVSFSAKRSRLAGSDSLENPI